MRRDWTILGVLLVVGCRDDAASPPRPRVPPPDAMVSPCAGAADPLAGVWDEARAAAISVGFIAIQHPRGDETARRLRAVLDTYAARWAEARVEACAATRIRGDQPEAVMALRNACLDRRLDTLAALTAALSAPSVAIIDRGVLAATHLEPVDACMGATITAPARSHAEEVALVTAIEDLAVMHVDVVTPLREAIARGLDPETEVRAYAALLRETIQQGNLEEAVQLEAIARASLARAGDAAALDAELTMQGAALRSAEGRLTDARVELERARELYAQARGPDSLDAAIASLDLAVTRRQLGDLDAARADAARAIPVLEAALGPDHPLVARARALLQ